MKRAMAILLAAALFIGLFAGCAQPAPAPESSDSTQPPQAKKVTLKTVSMFGGTDPNAKPYQALSKAFTAANPHVTVEDDSTTSNQEWKTRIAADFAVGNEPDVIFYFTDANAADVLKANKFVTVEEIRKEFPDYGKDIKPDVLNGVAAPDGNVYALPLTGYYEGIYCNKDLFDQFNLELPTTYENLVKAIEVFNQNGIIPIAVSLNEVPHYWVEHLILGMGGVEDHSLNPKDPASIPETWVKGLEFFKTLRDMNAFPKDTDVIKNADAENLFKTKKAAMQLDGSWFANGIDDKENTTVVAFPPLPGGKKDPTEIIAGFSSGFYITKKAWEDPDKRKAAVDFVMTHTSKDSIAIYWGGAGTPAAECQAPADLPKLMLDGAKMASAAVRLDAATDSRLKPEAFSTMLRAIPDLSKGKVTAEEVVKQLVELNSK